MPRDITLSSRKYNGLIAFNAHCDPWPWKSTTAVLYIIGAAVYITTFERRSWLCF